MGETPRQSEEKPQKDWSRINDMYRDFKEKQKIKDKKIPSPTEKILLGENVDGLSAENQEMLRVQLERERQQNEQRRQDELKEAREDFERKWEKE